MVIDMRPPPDAILASQLGTGGVARQEPREASGQHGCVRRVGRMAAKAGPAAACLHGSAAGRAVRAMPAHPLRALRSSSS
jgi:hypothetical protein